MFDLITNLEDFLQQDIVYQWDSGHWYDWDISDKNRFAREELFNTNRFYKKVGECDE